MYEELVAEYLSELEIPGYVPRSPLFSTLPEPNKRNLIYPIIGVRRCGKTFYLFQLMDELLRSGVPANRMLYFPFDDDRLEPKDESTASRVLDAYFKLVPDAREGCYLFFDEIQEAPNWEAFVRRAAEQYNTTVVVSGSSSKLLSTDIPTKLRGRTLSHEMWPLSFPEFCLFHNVETGRGGARTTFERGVLETALERYLAVGGFPAVQKMSSIDRTHLLQDYADEIVTKDVLERFESASFRAGRRFARSALRSTGLRFSVNKQVAAMRSAGVSLSNNGAYALLDDFEDAHLVFKVSDYTLSIRDNPKSSYKVYAIDPGLALAVAPANHIDLGQRLETAVFIELMRRYGSLRDNVIASYSSKSCPEVDFVVGDMLLEHEHELIQVAVESGGVRDGRRANAKKYLSEVGNLKKAMAETGLSESTLITLDEEGDVDTGAGTVRFVPAWKWMLGS